MESHPVIVIGGGPAGLTAAHELIKLNRRPIVLEKHGMVGGLARTENYKGFHFDIGGHRFFTKVDEVQEMWREILGEDFLLRPRLSRIYYNRKFFYYPFRPLNALAGLGLGESALIVLSYLRWQLFPHRREETFEEWVTNRFGRRLFQTFFKTYTEKVWGISCSELRAEWAAQRIKDLSLKTALLSMLVKPKRTIKTLIDSFHYPRLGPGMMWRAVQRKIEQSGGLVRLNCEVARIRRSGSRIESLMVFQNGRQESVEGKEFIASMPLREFIEKLDPPPPGKILEAARRLRYRDLLTVGLIVNRPALFPDNWIYVHDPDVQVARIQNYKNWSAEMVPDPAKSSLGLEYFCAAGDELWSKPDAELVELGKREVERIGLASAADVEDGCVVRQPHAYPLYDAEYQGQLSVIREFVDGLENFQSIGRNGLHRYNNQDHAMMTGMLAARNLALGEKNDLWSVNTEPEYLEEVRGSKEAEILDVVEKALARVFMKLDHLAFGLSVGIVAGILLCLTTLLLVLKGGEVVGPNLQLLSQYFPGYRVDLLGSLFGLGYGFASGFMGGWLFAFFRNVAVLLRMAVIHRRVEGYRLRRLIDYLWGE
jgi:protoporphyrinogen oxidase